MTKKKDLILQFVKPKTKLRQERKKRELTTQFMADLVGLERRQYELKESGQYPFRDYEMLLISKKLNIPISELFF